MIDKEKELYQIAMWYDFKAIPIDWNKLPDGVIDSVPSDFVCDKLSFSKNGEIGKKTIIYFRKVKKFRKDIKNKYETADIIFGV